MPQSPIVMAPVDQNRSVVRRFVEEFLNRGNDAVLGEVLSPALVVEQPGHQEWPTGLAAMDRLRLVWKTAFPDLHVIITDLIVQGDVVALHAVLEGTHRGPFLGVPATGKRVQWSCNTMYHLKDGLITLIQDNEDFLGLFQQLGRFPEVDAF